MRIARALALFPDEVFLPETLETVKGHVFRSITRGCSRGIPGWSASMRREIKRHSLMYEDVVQRSTSERPAWLKVIIAFRMGWVMFGKKTARMGEQRYDKRSNHMTIISRL